MTRIVKAPDERRSELVDIAQKLFYTQGYEQTSIKDIVQAVGVAQGTFYYYFDSKKSVLEAIVEKNVKLTQTMLQQIVSDDTLSALPKWQQVVQASGNWKITRKEEMLEMTIGLLWRTVFEQPQIIVPTIQQEDIGKIRHADKPREWIKDNETRLKDKFKLYVMRGLGFNPSFMDIGQSYVRLLKNARSSSFQLIYEQE